jgi:hypothetical protein
MYSNIQMKHTVACYACVQHMKIVTTVGQKLQK